MNSKHVANALIVLCLIALVTWWRWAAAPLPVKPPTMPANPQQLARAPLRSTDVPADNPPPEPGAANVDPAVLQALAKAIAQQQPTANSLLTQLPPSAQLTEALTPGRPTAVGQVFFAEQPEADGKVTVLHDELIGFRPVGNGQYKPIYDAGSVTGTPDVAASVKKRLEAESGSATSIPIESDPAMSMMSMMDKD
jgi:hypothetical protein